MLNPLATYGRMPTTTQAIQNKINYNSQPMEEMQIDKAPNYSVLKPLLANRNTEASAKTILKNFHENLVEQIYDQQVHPVDRQDVYDPQMMGENAARVTQHMLNTERYFVPNPIYMTNQSDINEKMRSILIDWMVEVHLKFKLLPETLYLTINLLDRYLEKSQTQRTQLQLVGVTAMMIAAKYEEIYAPEVKDYVWITDKAFSKPEILKKEYDVLMTLDFQVTAPSSFRFLERFSKVLGVDKEGSFLAQYLLELSMLDLKMSQYRPSILAAAAIYASNKWRRIKLEWTAELDQLTGCTSDDIRPCLQDMLQVFKTLQASQSLKAVKRKFEGDKFGRVAKTYTA